jgi:hypothetical protein
MSRNPHDAERRLKQNLEEETYLAAEAEVDGQLQVDRLFQGAPVLEAPPGFADRVMVAIAAGRLTAPARRRSRRRFRLPWLFLLALLIVPLGTAALSAPGMAALGLMMQQAVLWLNGAAQDVGELFRVVAGYLPSPMVMLGLVAAVALNLLAFSWMMAYASTRRQLVVYRVPVRFH